MLCSRWSPPMASKEPFLKDCPELLTHFGAERPVLGKCLKAVFDQFRGHVRQHLDDCPQITASGIGTLDSLQLAEQEVGTGLGVDPFQCLNDLDAFLPIVLAVDQKAQEEDPWGVIAPVPGIMRLFWAFSPSTPPESPSQEDSSLANMLDTLEARCRSDGPPAGPRSIDPLPGSRSFLTVSAVA